MFGLTKYSINELFEYYNAARRAGKDLVMLVFPGENHSVRRKENQIDYHHRILQWFGHYLNPAPKWISEGLSYADQQKANKKGGVREIKLNNI